MAQDQNALLTISEVTDELGISRPTWCKLVKAGKAPPIIKIGGSKRIRRGALDAWIISQESNAA